VLAHARALLVGSTGATAYVNADLRDTAKILEAAAKTLDFTRPVALMLLFILHYIPDEDSPHQIVAQLLDALPAGSYLAVSHAARDLSADANVVTSADRLNERMSSTPLNLRAPKEIERFFDGLEMVEPGLVQLPQWRPDPERTDPGHGASISAYCGIGRKG
jgi:O-methyltransferase involved in polyketide biosynthesis